MIRELTEDVTRGRLHEERTRGECALAQQASALAAARRARAQLQAQHERERAALRERARTLQRRLAALDSEYSAQLDNLRAAYQVRRFFNELIHIFLPTRYDLRHCSESATDSIDLT